MPRPVPETGQFEYAVVDLVSWERVALADQTISEQEARELLRISKRMARTGNRLVRSVQFVMKVLSGAQGMDSVCVTRAYEQRQAERAWEAVAEPSAA